MNLNAYIKNKAAQEFHKGFLKFYIIKFLNEAAKEIVPDFNIN